jgi:hypothetical protein
MSSRDEGDVWPFERDPQTNLYDLNTPGQAYWQRFKQFLELAAERDIVVQIEVWDRFDFARAPWQDNPYNPKNNINYTVAESGLRENIQTHPGEKENAFFRSVPNLENNQTILKYQQLQINKMLSISLSYGNVLYCMDNETNESPEWGKYWANYIKTKATEADTGVETTEMWDAWNLLEGEHAATFDHPEIYSFIDISQNNHQPAHTHWANPQEIRRRFMASGHIRPMNSVKIYGANTGRYGSTRDAQERFWRNIFGGFSSSRFHRPPSGLGLNKIAQANIQSMRMLTNELNIFACEPHQDLLQNKSWDEAYCTANPGVEYAVFFPDGGDILLDVTSVADKFFTRWLDIRKCQWTDEALISSAKNNFIRLSTPTEEGYWAVLLKAVT